eukprot:scaffold13000_cov193-Alexandrium_tamarense.AAC.12
MTAFHHNSGHCVTRNSLTSWVSLVRQLSLCAELTNISDPNTQIAGARRKLSRGYDLHFLDGPIVLEDECANDDDMSLAPRSWWLRSDDGKHTLVDEALDYVIQHTDTDSYDAILGFSQGGTLATALSLSGAFPNIRAVITAGAPYIPEAFEVAASYSSNLDNPNKVGYDTPKLHLVGETDALVAVESTRQLCEHGGNGSLIVHDQGHLFPTRSARVQEILDFLTDAFSR